MTNVRDLEPFFIAPYLRANEITVSPSHANALPSALLDPHSLATARDAYDSAVGELRSRSKASLRPGVRHLLANRILSFAIFGERDPRSLADRALAHFP